MKRNARNLFILVLALLPACNAQRDSDLDAYFRNIPFEMPRLERPAIPARTVSLADFGGVPDGVTLNTEAFAEAIENLAGKGGGRLEVPAGIWFTGPITLKSNIELHLDADAVIVFSTDQDLYPIIDTNFEGLDVRRCLSPVNALGEKNIAITGKGIIDGNGAAWREVKRRKVSDDQWKRIVAAGGLLSEDGKVWFPDEGYMKARATAGSLNYPDPSFDENEIKTFLRPVLVSLRECENVLLEGVTFQNSPCWNLHPLYCKNVIVKDVNVRNPHYSANGDGIDIDACENVLLVGSTFDVGDDAICIKSGKDADGRRHARKCRNLVIADCTVYHGHGGFVVGSEMSGGVEDILVRDCRFLGTDVGLRFKSRRGRGGVVSNIFIDHIYMKDIVAEALLFDLYYGGKSAVEVMAEGGEPVEEAAQPVDETTPCFRDIYISDIVCNGAARAMFFNGIPEMPVKNVAVDRCTITGNVGIQLCWAEDVTMRNTVIVPRTGEPVTTLFCKNVSVE